MSAPVPSFARRAESPVTRWSALAARFALAARVAFSALAAFAGFASTPTRVAFAHAAQSSVYSKFEATTSGRAIAVVFAFNTPAVLRVLQHDADARVDRSTIDTYGELFSRYVFPRFTIANEGQPCAHPATLARFFWDAAGDHVIAVTKFECASLLGDLVIHSVVTRDMPLPHELVGDLRHGHSLVRHFFSSTDADAHITLGSLAQDGLESAETRARDAGAPGASGDTKIPDQERLYEELASKTLDIDLPAEAPRDVHPFATLAHFVGEGIRHILTGYDHVAFILTLILAVKSWRQLGLVVTAFTAAHSVTLALATLGLVTLPARFVEPLIALSVFIVAVDAIARPRANARISMAFGFGLVHGLGLSNVLRDLGLSGRELLPALLGFNVGVEIGQLAIVAPMFVLVLRLRRSEVVFSRSRNAMCAAVALASAFWFVVRVRDAFFT